MFLSCDTQRAFSLFHASPPLKRAQSEHPKKEFLCLVAKPAPMGIFTIDQLKQAWEALPEEIRETPFHRARQQGLCLKLETLQPTGSYKIRAAYLRLARQTSGNKGVALSSSGNFAGAFTWAAHRLGTEAHLVVTPTVSARKMELARRHPCQVHVCGNSYESRFETLNQLAEQQIETIDHRTCHTVFLGHSTIGWECLCQQDHFDRVLIPVSTGGLAIGVAAALREGGFRGEILGVQPAGNPTLYNSWRAGAPMASRSADTICDALTATSIPQETYDLLKDLLDDILLVKEDSVLPAVGFLASEEGIVAEPGAAVGVGALLEQQRPWERTLCVLTGRNLDSTTLCNGVHAWEQHCQG
jgi:threonine dehydratase